MEKVDSSRSGKNKLHGYMYEDLNVILVRPENDTVTRKLCERCVMGTSCEKACVQLCFECGHCRTSYFTKEEFYMHLRKNHSNLVCLWCTAEKTAENPDQRHILKHKPCLFTRCLKCRFYFIDESNFEVHMRRCHGLQNTVTVHQLWVQHKLKIILLKVCGTCSLETGAKNVQHCEFCFMTVNSSFQKANHMRSKHAHCTKCDKWFAHTIALEYHELKLHSTNSHVCCYCHKSCGTSKELHLHVVGHATDTQQIEVDSEIRRCKGCLQWLSSLYALLLHIEEAHIYCPACYTFHTSYGNFKEHVLKFHEFWPLICNICKIKLFKIKTLRKHVHQEHKIDLPTPHPILENKAYCHTARFIKATNLRQSKEIATSTKQDKKINLILESLLDWPSQMNLGVRRRKPEDIIFSILKVLDPLTAKSCMTKKRRSFARLKDLLASFFFNIVGKSNEFLWILSCNQLKLVGDIETVLLKRLGKDELAQCLLPRTNSLNNTIAPMCGYCKKMFGSIEQLQSHIEHEHYYCSLCKRAVINLKAFSAHVCKNIHAGCSWPIMCYICGEKYWKLPELRWHMYIIHDVDYDTFQRYCVDVGVEMTSSVTADKLLAIAFSRALVSSTDDMTNVAINFDSATNCHVSGISLAENIPKQKKRTHLETIPPSKLLCNPIEETQNLSKKPLKLASNPKTNKTVCATSEVTSSCFHPNTGLGSTESAASRVLLIPATKPCENIASQNAKRQMGLISCTLMDVESQQPHVKPPVPCEALYVDTLLKSMDDTSSHVGVQLMCEGQLETGNTLVDEENAFLLPLYLCMHCQQTFSHADLVAAHISQEHTCQGMYSCNLCGKIVWDLSELKAHCAEHTKKDLCIVACNRITFKNAGEPQTELERKLIRLLRSVLDPSAQETIGLGCESLDVVLGNILNMLQVDVPWFPGTSDTKTEWCFRELLSILVEDLDITWTQNCKVEELIDDMQATLQMNNNQQHGIEQNTFLE